MAKKRLKSKTSIRPRTSGTWSVSPFMSLPLNVPVAGVYCTRVGIAILEEALRLDFMVPVGEELQVVSRVFVSPKQAVRLRDLLTEQIKVQKKMFGKKKGKVK